MRKITSNQVKEIKENMSCADIKNLLGETLDNGLGAYVLNYIVDNNYILVISFSSMAQPANWIGEELLNNLTPIEEYMN